MIPLIICSSSTIYLIVLNIFRYLTHELLEETYLETFLLFGLCLSCILPICYGKSTIDSILPYQAMSYMLSFISFKIASNAYLLHVQGPTLLSTDISGKVYVITGSNTGIGYETAQHLVKMGGTVVLACRSIDKAKAAQSKIMHDTKSSASKVLVLELDLCDFDSVKSFVKNFKSLKLPLHGLINNAGIMSQERMVTKAGLEMVFTANHLGHFLLTNLLLPDLELTKGRIVVLTSSLYCIAKRIDFEDLMSTKYYELFHTYAMSKFANVLFTLELQRRLLEKQSFIICTCVHPGCVQTEVTRNMLPLIRMGYELASPLLRLLQKNSEEGSRTSVYCATHPSLSFPSSEEIYENLKGKLYFHCTAYPLQSHAMNLSDAKKLWDISEILTNSHETKNK